MAAAARQARKERDWTVYFTNPRMLVGNCCITVKEPPPPPQQQQPPQAGMPPDGTVLEIGLPSGFKSGDVNVLLLRFRGRMQEQYYSFSGADDARMWITLDNLLYVRVSSREVLLSCRFVCPKLSDYYTELILCSKPDKLNSLTTKLTGILRRPLYLQAQRDTSQGYNGKLNELLSSARQAAQGNQPASVVKTYYWRGSQSYEFVHHGPIDRITSISQGEIMFTNVKLDDLIARDFYFEFKRTIIYLAHSVLKAKSTQMKRSWAPDGQEGQPPRSRSIKKEEAKARFDGIRGLFTMAKREYVDDARRQELCHPSNFVTIDIDDPCLMDEMVPSNMKQIYLSIYKEWFYFISLDVTQADSFAIHYHVYLNGQIGTDVKLIARKQLVYWSFEESKDFGRNRQPSLFITRVHLKNGDFIQVREDFTANFTNQLKEWLNNRVQPLRVELKDVLGLIKPFKETDQHRLERMHVSVPDFYCARASSWLKYPIVEVADAFRRYILAHFDRLALKLATDCSSGPNQTDAWNREFAVYKQLRGLTLGWIRNPPHGAQQSNRRQPPPSSGHPETFKDMQRRKLFCSSLNYGQFVEPF